MNYLVELCKYANGYEISKHFESEKDMVFHYTTLPTLSIIIDKKEIRFADRFFLNDTTEGTYVLNLCKEMVDQLSFPDVWYKEKFIKECEDRLTTPQYDNFYVFQASFSGDKDSLAMWNYYGKKGCNLGFNVTKLKNGLHPDYKQEDNKPALYFGKVEYDKDRQIGIIKTIVNDFFTFSPFLQENPKERGKGSLTINVIINKIMTAGIFMKAPCFSIENEYRLAYDLCMIENKNDELEYALISDKQKVFEREGMLVPCIDIAFDPIAVESITIAPTLNYEYARNSILRAMNGKFTNISQSSVFQSEIPVRF